MSKLYTADKFVTIGGTTAQYVTGTGSLVTFPAIPSGADYIQNQIASAQSANMWISGNAIVNGSVGIGITSPTQKLEVSGNIKLADGGQWNIIGALNQSLGIYAAPNNSSEGIIFSTDNGTTAEMFIQDGGNVGIGTTTPGAKLEVNGNIKYNGDIFPTTAGRASILNETPTSTNPNIVPSNSSLATGLGGDNGNLALIINSSPAVYVNSSSNVGIGTTSPSQKLDVRGNYGQQLIIGDINQSGSIDIRRGSDGGKVFSLGFPSALDGAEIRSSHNGGGGFYTWYNNTGGTVSEKFRIDNNGNVGIGTSSPSVGKLQVNTFNSSNNALTIQASNHTSRTYGVGIDSASSLSFYDNFSAVARMVITTSGNVGIGTTSPNERLTVSGKIYANPQQPVVLSGQGAPYYGTNITLSSDIGSTQGANRIWSRYDGTGSGAITFERSTDSQAYNSDPQLLTYVESMRIGGNGYVGIGTITPVSKLTVAGGDIKVEQSGNTNATISLNPYTGALGTTYQWNLIGGNSGRSYGFEIAEGANTYLHINNSAGGNGGNVGIGTTSPSQLLHVSGNARITGAIYDSSNSAGTSGQTLSSTGTGTAWVTPSSPTIPGSNNEILTSDGSGGINAETNCIFDASIKTFIAGASIDPSAGTYLINSGVTSVLSDLDDWGYSSAYNATGEIMFKQTSDDAITRGDAIYLKANNKWSFAKGSNGPSSSSMLGIALNDTTGADEFVAVLLKGFVSTVRVLDDTADAGAPMYLSTNAAQITNVAPTGTNSTVRIVGYTYINTINQGYGLYILRFDPDSTWIDN